MSGTFFFFPWGAFVSKVKKNRKVVASWTLREEQEQEKQEEGKKKGRERQRESEREERAKERGRRTLRVYVQNVSVCTGKTPAC